MRTYYIKEEGISIH